MNNFTILLVCVVGIALGAFVAVISYSIFKEAKSIEDKINKLKERK
jgi:uncharacterized membrane-anchored protein YhcB (DUF1043 family)